MMKVSSTTDPEELVQAASALAQASDFVGLVNLIRKAYIAGVDSRVIQMMSSYLETSMF